MEGLTLRSIIEPKRPTKVGFFVIWRYEMSKQQITIWESWNQKRGEWKHNHIEFGWMKTDKPNPKTNSKEQKGWNGQKWKRELGWLINNVVKVKK